MEQTMILVFAMWNKLLEVWDISNWVLEVQL